MPFPVPYFKVYKRKPVVYNSFYYSNLFLKYFRMMYFVFVVIVALAVQVTYADLVHGMLYFSMNINCDKIEIDAAFFLLPNVYSSNTKQLHFQNIKKDVKAPKC